MQKLTVLLLYLLIVSVTQACDFDDVTFSADFVGGRLHHCEKLADDHFLLSVKPENRPINSSPWYAFEVTAKANKHIRIELEFDGDAPRYLPKSSTDFTSWQSLLFNIEDNRLQFSVDVAATPLRVAGQEIIDNDYYARWLSEHTFAGAEQIELGKSTQGRSIAMLEFVSKESREWLIVLGRQHPPEITGVLAMLPFVEALFADTELATAFRKRFNLLVVPNLNPDGVVLGNWRHNAKGVDLNRDWKNLTQQETRLLHDAIQTRVAKQARVVMAVDFHSTHQDVFYTMPADYPLAPTKLMDNWLAALKARTKANFVVRPKPGNNPDNGVFKQYIADTYQVPAVTYEMGDNTDRQLIRYVAQQAAQTLMQTMLDTPAEAFKYKSESE